MKMARNLVAALVALATTASAFGSVQVWYSAVGQNPNSLVDPGAGPGQTLQLKCNNGAGATSCSWVVTMNAVIAGGLTGWGTDLGTSNGQTSVSNVAAPAGNPYPAANTQVGTPGSLNSLTKPPMPPLAGGAVASSRLAWVKALERQTRKR